MLPPNSQTPYHLHKKRESIFVAISGEAVEVVDGKENPFKTNDIIYVPAGEKHMTANRSDKEFFFIEFITNPADKEDFVYFD